MRKKIFILALLAAIAALMSLTIEISDFEDAINENPVILKAGAPELPYLPVKILLPMGENLSSIKVTYSGNQNKVNRYLPPVQMPQPFSMNQIIRTDEDIDIYKNNKLYPAEAYRLAGIQRQNGYDIVILHLFAWHYNPLSREISWQNQANIEFETQYSDTQAVNQAKMLTSSDRLQLNSDIYNLQAQDSYIKNYQHNSRNLPDPSQPYKMILITSQEVSDWFDDFINWKAEHDLETGVFYTEDIYSEYTGFDNQEKIKNFIIDAYQTWSGTDTPLEYVILGGDDEIIPIRGVYINASGTIDQNLPCDLYYTCLDNSWDDSQNGVYGEVEDNVDLVPEIAIGRIPADNNQDVINWFNKLTHYVDNNTYSNNICYMLGEYLWGNPDTWGGDSMDLLLEEIDEPFHVETMYQRDGTYSEYGVTLAINGGLGLINHLGHANEGFVFGQTRPSAASYTNSEYGFVYSQGCYPSAFDETTGQASECIAENFVIRPNGMFGMIGNSRYGWGIPGQPAQGPSQRYHLPFIQAVFNLDIRQFGKALQYSRQVMAEEALGYAHLRWVHYELTLLGDPSIALKAPDENFPFLAPEDPVYNDTEGDGDGAINPGETIEVTIPITADFDWANAENVTAEITFQDSAVTMENSVINYGDIAAGETVTAQPVIVTVPQDCNYDRYPYTVTIHAPVNTGGEFVKSYVFDFEVSIQQTNWPWFISERLSVAPILIDLDDDDDKDILISTMNGEMRGLNILSEELPGFPWNTEETIEKHTAVGDVDNDGEPEVVIATRSGNIYARNLDGSIAWQHSADSDQLVTPVLTDFDGDGKLETVSYGMNGELTILDENGDNESGFPLSIGEICYHEMAAADFNGDGATEIALVTISGNLHLINYAAGELPGFPVELPSNPASGVIILDNLNLALGCLNGSLLVYSPAGQLLTEKQLSSILAAAPIAADFDGDDELEIAYTTRMGEVGICNQDGSDLNGYPLFCEYSITQPPLAVDIDGSNSIDLIWFSSNNILYVYRNDGTEIEFSPVPLNYNDNFPASIADLDADNDFEIVLSTSNRIIVIDSKLSKGSLMPWSTYRGNLQRTAYFEDNEVTASNPQNITPVNKLHANFPNPFNPETVIRFELAKQADAKLNIYNIKGQKIFRKSITAAAAGEHQIVWKGKDDLGNPVASGVYFYQLLVDGRSAGCQRMLLLK